MSRPASLALAPALAAALALAPAALAKRPAKLTGTVGPGYTITLTKGGKKVKRLKAGKYRFTIADKSSFHSFVLEKEKGGKFEKQLTSVSFVGKKSFTIKLTRGKWKYYCAPHESLMQGFFKVT